MAATPPLAAKPSQPTGPRKNPWRERLKAELAVLREQVCELEKQQRELEMEKHPPPHLARIRPGADPALAMAVVENRRLKSALQRRLETGRALVEAITGLTVEELGLDLFSAAKLLPEPSVSHFDMLNHRAAWLLADVDRAYQEIDTVLEPVGMDLSRKPPATSFFSRFVDGQQELVLEMREALTIQLDFDRFMTSLRHAANQASWPGFRKEMEDKTKPEFVATHVKFDRQIHGEKLDMSATVITKRFVEADRVTIVWRSMTCIENNDRFADVFIEDTGYSRMTRVVNPENGEEIVFKQNCIHVVPRSASDSMVTQYSYAGAFTNLVLSCSWSTLASVDEMVENTLIDACMGEVATPH